MDAFLIGLGERRFALPAEDVRGVARLASLSPLHGAPAGVDGTTSLRGETTAVLDPRERLGLPRAAPRRGDLLVVVAVEGRRVALRIDAAWGFASAEDEPALLASAVPLSDLRLLLPSGGGRMLDRALQGRWGSAQTNERARRTNASTLSGLLGLSPSR